MGIPSMPASKEGIVSKLAIELDAALGLLREFQQVADTQNPEKNLTSPLTLLDQCMALCTEHSAAQPEPVRTVHHFACTGGTLISKCIASMPNTQLLSEVDPFNTPVKAPAKPQFAPTDMVTLMRQSTRGTSHELIAELFLNNLEVIHRQTMNSGLRLVLRHHAHSHYCRGNEVQDRPDLRTLVSSKFPVLSLVTVRDPIDSYLSLKANGWVHFTPATFDEYCRRYLAFIRAYEGVPIIRFEDFVNDPENEMVKICELLDLPFNPDFRDLFSVYRITGDSGRSGISIETRPRRTVDTALASEFKTSVNYQNLRLTFGFD
jgi:hypothetical protein